MGAARIVADIAAERAVLVGRRIGREGQTVLLRRLAQLVVDRRRAARARAVSSGSSARSRFMYFEKSSTTATLQALARQAGAAAAPEDRHVAFAASIDRGLDIRRVLRDDDADRDMAIDRQIGRVERAARRCRTAPRRQSCIRAQRRGRGRFASVFWSVPSVLAGPATDAGRNAAAGANRARTCASTPDCRCRRGPAWRRLSRSSLSLPLFAPPPVIQSEGARRSRTGFAQSRIPAPHDGRSRARSARD